MKKLTTLLTTALTLAICSHSFAQDSSEKGPERKAGQAAEETNQTTPRTGTTTQPGTATQPRTTTIQPGTTTTNPRAVEQNRAQQTQEDSAVRSQGDHQFQQRTMTDFFAGKLILMNQNTIEMSEMAEQKSTSQEVKDFAKMLADEHRQSNEKLNKQCPQVFQHLTNEDSNSRMKHKAGFRGEGQPNNESVEQPAATEAQATQDTTESKAEANRRLREEARSERVDARGQRTAESTEYAAKDSGEKDVHGSMHKVSMPIQQILEIEQHAAKNYQQASNQMLEKYQGQDFDMGFLGFQIASHTWSLAELKAIDSKKVGDQEFQKLISDATQSTEQHLKKAQMLAKNIEDNQGATSGNRKDASSNNSDQSNKEKTQNSQTEDRTGL